jgi:hypothetical protein
MSKCPKQQLNYLKIAETMSKCPKQQPNYLKIAETSIVLIVFSGVHSEMISIFPIVKFPFICSNIPVAPAYAIMGYISLSWYDIPELVIPIRISLIEGCC